MKDKRTKYKWLLPMPNESTYQVGNTTYIVSSVFAEPNQNSHTLRSRFERIIKNNSADLSTETQGDIITAEYVSAANPISDRKEQNAEENSSQTE